ncbi:MAG: QueT transporter family protein [Coriobacteriia bacterium]|nr:QueT transporter family protein [Coriobacteriia bacterium]
MNSRYVAQTGIIAAAYAAFTLISILFLGSLAWGPIQFRISELMVITALFTPAAVPGMTLGCLLANLINIPLSGTGALGMLDVVFGSLATFLSMLFIRKFKERPRFALLAPVLINALIVSAYLPLILKGIGYYTIPFTTIALDGFYLWMYLFGFIATAIGQGVVIYLIGYPLYRALKKFEVISEE